MTSSLVIQELRDSIAIVRMNRAPKLNALSREILEELGSAFERLASERELRVVILTGVENSAFSAGTDIAELAALDEVNASVTSRLGQALCDRIASFCVPVIAAIGGVAAGGGCELALACHLRIASTEAQFSLPETKIGMIPAYGGTQRLGRIIGSGRAMDMALTGRTVSADEAVRIGLVTRVADPDKLMSEAELLAGEIVSLAPLAIRACLEAVTKGLELPLQEGLELEAQLFSRLFATDDVREGTHAFLEKRAPVFKGE